MKFVVYILAITMVNVDLFLQCIWTNVRLKKIKRERTKSEMWEKLDQPTLYVKDTKLNDGKCEQAGSLSLEK